MNVDIDNTLKMNKHGYILIKLNLWKLKSEIHVIFTCHKILFLF